MPLAGENQLADSSGGSGWRDEADGLLTLIDAGNVAQRSLQKRLTELGLSIPQQRILASLYAAGHGLTLSMIALVLLQKIQNLTDLLRQLEDRALIRREYDRNDRRVVWIRLTPEGSRAAVAVNRLLDEVAREYRQGVGGQSASRRIEELRQLRELGIRIADLNPTYRRRKDAGSSSLAGNAIAEYSEQADDCDSAPPGLLGD